MRLIPEPDDFFIALMTSRYVVCAPNMVEHWEEMEKVVPGFQIQIEPSEALKDDFSFTFCVDGDDVRIFYGKRVNNDRKRT